MPRQKLPPDATIATTLPTLDKADDYVRTVYAKLNAAHKQHGDAVLRLGVMGYGVAPNYRIEVGNPPKPIATYDGASHKEFTDTSGAFPDNWSTVAMSLQEVKELFSQMRSFLRHQSA